MLRTYYFLNHLKLYGNLFNFIIVIILLEDFILNLITFFYSEKYVLKFLPKLLKNSNVGSFMGKEGRLCSPRFIFFFEKCLNKDSEGENITI